MGARQDTPELIARAQAGDREAVERLIAEHRAPLEASVRARLGAHLRTEVEVDDVLQETYVQALSSVESFQWAGEGSFLRWLRGVAEHVILNLARRQRNDPILYLEQDRPHGGPSPSRHLRRRERLDRLQDAVEGLPPDYREAVLLVRIEGLRIQDAAARMGRTPKAVKHLLARALARLKDTLGDTESLSLPPSPLRDGGGLRDGT
jgi:RNA polymerase sigma-70 factor (ECF subfamily)